jgi:hypothetical protein
MEAYRLAKSDRTLPKAEKSALLAIADACAMREGVCRKAIPTLAADFGKSIRQIKYGLHGRPRENGGWYFTGLIAKGLVLVVAGGHCEDGVPTTYRIDLDRLRAHVLGADTSAQTHAQTCAQNSDDPCTNDDEPVHNGVDTRAQTRALMHPSSLSSKSSSTPSTPDGDGGGEKPPGENQRLPQEPCETELLTEQSMIDVLQRSHVAKWKEHCETSLVGSGRELVPREPSTAGSVRLFEALQARRITTADQMQEVCEAYQDWFEAKYLLSFEKHMEARMRNVEDRNDYVPEVIDHPFTRFRKEMKLFLDDVKDRRSEVGATGHHVGRLPTK